MLRHPIHIGFDRLVLVQKVRRRPGPVKNRYRHIFLVRRPRKRAKRLTQPYYITTLNRILFLATRKKMYALTMKTSEIAIQYPKVFSRLVKAPSASALAKLKTATSLQIKTYFL